MKSSNYIRTYIRLHQLNTTKISYDTGVPLQKLSLNCNQPFNAIEFLDLCYYLNLKPEAILSEISRL